MNLSDPIRAVIPSSYGPVLEVLARTETPLTGRTIASLTDGRVGVSQVSAVLRELVANGLVLVTEHPPANLYLLNRDHVAADAIQQLARLRETLLERMRHQVMSWEVPPVAVWLFGSLARGEGGPESDIDVLVLTPNTVGAGTSPDSDPTPLYQEWTDQVDGFSDNVHRWSGNDCRVVEFTETEFEEMLAQGDRLAMDVIQDGVHLGGKPKPKSMKARGVSTS